MKTRKADLVAELLQDCQNNEIWPDQVEVVKMITGEITPEKIDNIKTLRIQLINRLLETAKWGLAKETLDAEFLMVDYVNQIGFITNKFELLGRSAGWTPKEEGDMNNTERLCEKDLPPEIAGLVARIADKLVLAHEAGEAAPINALTAWTEGEAEIVTRRENVYSVTRPNGLQPHALPPGRPTPVSFSTKHVADMSPAEHERRKKYDRIRRRALRARKKAALNPS